MTLSILWQRQKQGVNGSMLEVVPENWQDVDGNQGVLYTYHYGHSKVIKVTRRGEVPSDEWRSFPIVKVLYKKSMCTQYVLVVTLNSAFLSRLKYSIMLQSCSLARKL